MILISDKNTPPGASDKIFWKDILDDDSSRIYTFPGLKSTKHKHYDHDQSTHGNRDYSLESYEYQDKYIEPIAKQISNRSVGMALEAAGDIIRELTSVRIPSSEYIGEKVRKIQREISQHYREFTTKLSPEDGALADRAAELYMGLRLETEKGKSARRLAVAVAERNISKIIDTLKVFDALDTVSTLKHHTDPDHDQSTHGNRYSKGNFDEKKAIQTLRQHKGEFRVIPQGSSELASLYFPSGVGITADLGRYSHAEIMEEAGLLTGFYIDNVTYPTYSQTATGGLKKYGMMRTPDSERDWEVWDLSNPTHLETIKRFLDSGREYRGDAHIEVPGLGAWTEFSYYDYEENNFDLRRTLLRSRWRASEGRYFDFDDKELKAYPEFDEDKIKQQLRSVSLKHYEHDQSTHGNWAREKFLKDLPNKKIVSFEPLPNGGITRGFFVTFDDGSQGVWKPLSVFDEKVGFKPHVGDSEVGAYRLSKLLGLHIVPPTDYYEWDGMKGTVQMRVTGESPIRLDDEDVKKFVSDHSDLVAEMILLDTVTNDTDRHAGNWLIDTTGEMPRLWAVDNGNVTWKNPYSLVSRAYAFYSRQRYGGRQAGDIEIPSKLLKRWERITFDEFKDTLRDLGSTTPAIFDTSDWVINAWNNLQGLIRQGGLSWEGEPTHIIKFTVGRERTE